MSKQGTMTGPASPFGRQPVASGAVSPVRAGEPYPLALHVSREKFDPCLRQRLVDGHQRAYPRVRARSSFMRQKIGVIGHRFQQHVFVDFLVFVTYTYFDNFIEIGRLIAFASV
jgi:hypothetical protein